MRVHILSDLHLEFGKMPKAYRPPECDAVILAGDIGVGRAGMAWAMETFPETLPVIYVAGNHEFYNRSLALIEELRAKAAATPNIKFLENNTVDIGGVRFIGSTLWTDFNLYGQREASVAVAERGMTDFRVIDDFYAEDWLFRNSYARGYIDGALERYAEQPCVVVTHHAPDPGSVVPRFEGDALNPAFASRFLETLEKRPQLWVHGHMHDSIDYVAHDTRVVVNPRGYVGYELNPKFDPQFVVEIDV